MTMSAKVPSDVRSRVYVAGCGGMLGDALYRELVATGSEVLATDISLGDSWLEHCDVRNYAQCRDRIRDFRPTLIINLAALTDLELCELSPDDAWLTNALGAENLGLVAEDLGVPYIFISTAGIFDGAKDHYTDFDEPNPLSVYAKSKYYGERFTLRYVRKHYVVRAGWMMGGGPRKDKKFINKLHLQLKAGAKELFVVEDKCGTPTYTVDFAKGLLHIAGSGQ